jgi:hypothetical protein
MGECPTIRVSVLCAHIVAWAWIPPSHTRGIDRYGYSPLFRVKLFERKCKVHVFQPISFYSRRYCTPGSSMIWPGFTSSGHMPTSPTLTPTPILSSQATVYLSPALDIMQQYSVNRKKLNWTKVRQRTFAMAAGAKTPADTYSAIQHALTELGDHHSFFLEPQPANQFAAAPITSDQEPHGQLLAHGIGYLELPHFEASEQAAHHYVRLAQDAIRTANQAGTCGRLVC